MKKNLFAFVVFVAFFISQTSIVFAHEAYVSAHSPYVKQHLGYTSVLNNSGTTQASGSVVKIYPRPMCRQSAAVLSSGVNFVSRDIATGEIKQVVQVSSPSAYVGGCYY